MATHWMDANVPIQAKNGPYDFDRVPQFWSFIAEKIDSGEIKSPKFVYDELTKPNDRLAEWCKNRKNTGLRTTADKAVQEAYCRIADHVQNNYTYHQAAEFLRGADGWVIAHAMADGGIVATQESERSKKSKVKIPTVCRHFGVPCVTTYEMLANLDFRAA